MTELAPKLDSLIDSLERLVAIMDRDINPRWRIEVYLRNALAIRSDGLNEQEVLLLAGSVMHIFGGAGSFADYFPVARDGSPVAWMDELERVRVEVYDRALAIRVVAP